MEVIKNNVERDALSWIVNYIPAIRRVASRSLSKAVRKYLVDELTSHLIEKVPRLYAAYDQKHNVSLWCYVRNSLVWHARKWCAKRANYGPSMRKLESDCTEENEELYKHCSSYDAVANIEHSEEVLQYIGPLSEYDKVLLIMRHVEGLTYTEIARRAGMTVATTRVHCIRALENARQRVNATDVQA